VGQRARWRSVPPGLVYPCADGRAPITGRPCFTSATELPDVTWLTGELKAGRIKAFSELSPQYLGLSPADARLEPYWQLAEQFDLPVGIHMGARRVLPPSARYWERTSRARSRRRTFSATTPNDFYG
jgi:hypothetical protein